MKKNILSFVSILALSGQLYAGGDITPIESSIVEEPLMTESQSAFYVGLGYSYMSLKNDVSNEEFTTNAAMLQIGYQYNKYIALEGRYTFGIGDLDYDAGDLAISGLSDYPGDFTNIAIYLKPMYPIGDFNLYALLGYGEVEITNIPIGDVDRAEAGFQWGLGAEYNFNENVAVFIDYVQMYNDTGFDYRAQDSDILSDTWTLGVSYKF